VLGAGSRIAESESNDLGTPRGSVRSVPEWSDWCRLLGRRPRPA